ncbi:MAG TPA: tyrosine-protein phosphatase [Blastocatellia bacterium]|nr:tyrosine-protein phosphatase [Blastocatellia bacterium]
MRSISARIHSRASSLLRAAVWVMLLAVLAAPAAFSRQVGSFPELPNFHKVNDHLYRGGQMRMGGIKRLGDLGIKTIVDLRGMDGTARWEKKEAEALHIAYFSIPMSGISRPSSDQIWKVLGVVDNPANWPVYVHCEHGSDRTGTVVACYHILHDGWQPGKAILEAKSYGMSWTEFGMRRFIEDFYNAQTAASNAARLKAAAEQNGAKLKAAAEQNRGASHP